MSTITAPRGLAGVVVTETELGDVRGREGFYHYRQYSAVDLAQLRTFEDVWYLMVNGELPDAAQCESFTARTAALRRPGRGPGGTARHRPRRIRSARRAADRAVPARRRVRLPAGLRHRHGPAGRRHPHRLRGRTDAAGRAVPDRPGAGARRTA